MDKLKVDYADIDDGVSKLVNTLNLAPFVRTLGSCEGHLRDYFGTAKVIPDKGKKFLWPGQIAFYVDEEQEQAQSFLDDIMGLKEKFLFVDFYIHRCRHKRCDAEGSRIFRAGIEDLTDSGAINEDDSVEARLKKSYQVEIGAGEQRIAEYSNVWLNFLEIACFYAQQQK